MPHNTKLILVGVAVVIVGGIIYIFSPHPVNQMNSPGFQLPGVQSPGGGNVACPQYAKLCPDGSYVGRTGPNCEFAACPPGATSGTASGATTKVTTTDPSSRVTFTYPQTLSTKYINAVDWPPHVTVLNQSFQCLEAGSQFGLGGQTIVQTINGHQYCVTRESGGAAGSVYTSYSYAMEKSGKFVVFTFILHFTDCADYNAAQRTACDNERRAFSIDPIIDQIIQSAKLPQ